MTSKKELQRQLEYVLDRNNILSGDRWTIKAERDAYKRENDILIARLQGHGEHHDELVQFIDDLFIIEPQLKHTLTNGVWDFERVHRAAEALRAEDALASVGYTDNEPWPDNVIPLFPHDPSNGRGAA